MHFPFIKCMHVDELLFAGLSDSFAAFWAKVAQEFQTNPYVIGYEILNEPWAGRHQRNLTQHMRDTCTIVQNCGQSSGFHTGFFSWGGGGGGGRSNQE